MTLPPQAPRERLLGATGHVLVTGGPGSGKTTLALEKAMARIGQGLFPGQSALFLSFSRAAVARLVEASAAQIPADQQDQLCLQTFHSFFWDLLRTHGYLLGTPRRLRILLPHDERAYSGGAKRDTPAWTDWETRRQELLYKQGLIAFDLFGPTCCELILRSPLLRSLVARQHPLIIVDEAQDTGEEAWSFVAGLKDYCQIVCLADLDQQIFDHLPGIGPERIATIRRELIPLEIDLGLINNRCQGTDIGAFARDVLENSPRGAAYPGVSSLKYNLKTTTQPQAIRRAIAVAMRQVRKQTGARPQSCAILAPTGKDIAQICAALSAEPKPVAHKVVFDEATSLLASRFAAFLIEPKTRNTLNVHAAEALELLADIARAAGTTGGRDASARYRKWAQALRQGQVPKVKAVVAMTGILGDLCNSQLQGDPVRDWLTIKARIRDCGDRDIASISGLLDYLVAFKRGRRIAAALSALWTETGTYARARQALDTALAQEALLAGMEDLTGIHVMTIHRSKGKQFDAVIIYRRNVPIGPNRWQSSLVWRDDHAPYTRSRKILRVGLTRARKHVLILEPIFPQCPLLRGHRL